MSEVIDDVNKVANKTHKKAKKFMSKHADKILTSVATAVLTKMVIDQLFRKNDGAVVAEAINNLAATRSDAAWSLPGPNVGPQAYAQGRDIRDPPSPRPMASTQGYALPRPYAGDVNADGKPGPQRPVPDPRWQQQTQPGRFPQPPAAAPSEFDSLHAQADRPSQYPFFQDDSAYPGHF